LLGAITNGVDSRIYVLTATCTVTDLTIVALLVRVLLVGSSHTEARTVAVLTRTAALGVGWEVTRTLYTGTATEAATLALFVRVESVFHDRAGTTWETRFINVTSATSVGACRVTAHSVLLITASAVALIINGAGVTVDELRLALGTVAPVSVFTITVDRTGDFTETVAGAEVPAAVNFLVGALCVVLTFTCIALIVLVMAVATAAGAGRTTTCVVHTEVAIALVGTCVLDIRITACGTHDLLRFTASLLTLYGIHRKVTEEALEAIAIVRTGEVTLGCIAGVTFTEYVVRIFTISDTVALMRGVAITLCTGLRHALCAIDIQATRAGTVTSTVLSTGADRLLRTVILRIGSQVGW